MRLLYVNDGKVGDIGEFLDQLGEIAQIRHKGGSSAGPEVQNQRISDPSGILKGEMEIIFERMSSAGKWSQVES